MRLKFFPAPGGRISAAGWLLLCSSLLLAPIAWHSTFALTFLASLCVMVIFSLSYNLLFGEAGMMSFAHAVFAGLASYATIHALVALGANGGTTVIAAALLPLVGGLVGALFGVVFGYVVTQRAGIPFAMITIGISELLFIAATTFTGFFGGEAGVGGSRVIGSPLFGIDFGSALQMYYLTAVWAVVVALAVRHIASTPLGRLSNAVRDSAERVSFLGYDPVRVRFKIFWISCFFAGISGALGAMNSEFVAAESVHVFRSGGVLLSVFIGGTYGVLGPFVGAIIYTLFSVLLSHYSAAWMFYLGVFFLLIVLFLPKGISSVLAIWIALTKYERRILLPSAIQFGAALLIAVVPLVITVEGLYAASSSAVNSTRLGQIALSYEPTGVAYWAWAALAWVLVGTLIAVCVQRLNLAKSVAAEQATTSSNGAVR